jgi:hypothetical protein
MLRILRKVETAERKRHLLKRRNESSIMVNLSFLEPCQMVQNSMPAMWPTLNRGWLSSVVVAGK